MTILFDIFAQSDTKNGNYGNFTQFIPNEAENKEEITSMSVENNPWIILAKMYCAMANGGSDDWCCYNCCESGNNVLENSYCKRCGSGISCFDYFILNERDPRACIYPIFGKKFGLIKGRVDNLPNVRVVLFSFVSFVCEEFCVMFCLCFWVRLVFVAFALFKTKKTQKTGRK